MGPALFFSLLIITFSFLPIFTLQAQEGRLSTPLAFTKTYAMAPAALLSITLVPILMGFFIRGEIILEKKNPVKRFCQMLHQTALVGHRYCHWSFGCDLCTSESTGIGIHAASR